MRSGAAENSTRWRTTALPGNCLRFSDGLIPVLTFIYSWWFNQMLDFHCCQTAPPPAAATQTSLYLNLSTALEDKRSPPPKNHSLFPTPYRLLQCQIYVVCLEQGTYYGLCFFEPKKGRVENHWMLCRQCYQDNRSSHENVKIWWTSVCISVWPYENKGGKERNLATIQRRSLSPELKWN